MGKMVDKIDIDAIATADSEVDKDITIRDTLTNPFKAEKKALIEKAVTKPEQLSFLPTKLCRSTIFYPLPRKGRKALQAEPLKLVFETDLAAVKYYGMRMSVDDEDLLLVCLYLAKKQASREVLTTYTELQKLLGTIPNQKYNKRIREAFERLGVAAFSIKYKNKRVMFEVNKILKPKGLDRKVHIKFDEDFYKEFLENYTLMSLPFRMKLKGDLAKLLFTFLSSHRTPVSYFTKTLAEALNMNTDQDKKYLARKLREAFKELQDKGFLVDFKYDSKQDLFTLKPIERKKWKGLK